MGIYDRDYYRREGPGFLGSLAEQGRITNWLIGLNVLCFLVQFFTRTLNENGRGSDEPFTRFFDLDVSKVLGGEIWRLFTYAFLHSTENIFHIVFNMLFLFWFGRQAEDALGGREYLLFYLFGVLVSGLAFFLAGLTGFHGAVHLLTCVGASGAVTAVLVLSAMINPRQTIYLFFVIPVPIWAFVVLMLVQDFLPFVSRNSGTVATSAHLGGAAFAFLYRRQSWRFSRLTEWVRGRPRAVRPVPRLRLYQGEESESFTPATPRQAPPRPVERAVVPDEQLEAQLDAILAKISREGMSGLTDNERQVLSRASEAIKRRRG